MFYKRLEAVWRTLRFRLAAWNATVVVATALITLFGLREGVRYTLLSELDQLLHEDLHEIGLSVAALHYPTSGNELQEELERKARGHTAHNWFVQLLDFDGQELWSSYGTPGMLKPVSLLSDRTAHSIDQFRIIQTPVPRDGASDLVVRVGASLSFLQRDLARVDRLVAIAGGIALLVAPVCGYWLAGRATQPLADFIHTAERLRPEKLDERLPMRRTGDELDKLSQTVNGLLDRIAAYIDRHRDLLANAAHELRTPLAAIRSSVEVALNGKRSREEYEELLTAIISEGESLEHLVNQLLLLAETETDQLQACGEPVPLDNVVATAIDMFRGAAEFHEIELRTGPLRSVYVMGSRHHLRQVINNLLDNAIKFTGRGGHITVELEWDEPRREAVLRVVDTGVGIAASDLPKLFERFFRADKSRRRDVEQRGTGLGLSICKAVVEAHHGHLAVESTPGKGSAFTVRLPASLQPVSARPTTAERDANGLVHAGGA